ncbi:MAG TPA: bifunctional adenosylcobinamide kinase/adenosylcobinamide-phosphate guanylyltransferase [Actinobacteria bacterium]|jgi:adenosylcobinamide kinase/adenosylcobinamide-phosphate guanylyltransferase|nr:bifunctional adenosylcobinamide kinase/adenosylcobinamide-phosphate guanylyltransferase [Actinomycetota bacterium]
MGNIFFLLGGARSGKSSYAEKMAQEMSRNVAYLATSEIIDDEMKKRVASHRKRRPSTWKTYEIEKRHPAPEDMKKIFDKILENMHDVVLIDCITILLFRIIHKFKIDESEIVSNKLEKQAEKEVKEFFSIFLEMCRNISEEKNIEFIIVSNEVGMGIVPSYPLGRIFRDIMGMINIMISEISDEIYFFIAGNSIRIK